jgi:hypothetical protein
MGQLSERSERFATKDWSALFPAVGHTSLSELGQVASA